MQTTVSLPGQLLRSADALAKRLGVSRGELHARALVEYLAKHRGERITEQLNSVFANEDSGLDPVLAVAQARALLRESW